MFLLIAGGAVAAALSQAIAWDKRTRRPLRVAEKTAPSQRARSGRILGQSR
jgi:hypothetical protein